MMDKNPFLKRLMKVKTEDVVHSSAYAKAQNEEGIGVASTRGFGERMRMEKNRTSVRSYKESEVVSDSKENAPRAKTYDPAQDIKKYGYGVKGANRAATGRAMMASKTNSAASAPAKPSTPPAWKNPGISR